jgi:TolB-like protein
MKKISVLLLAAVCSAGIAYGQDKQKVAVYVTGGKTDADNKVMGQKLVSAITKSPDFAAIERTADFLSQLSKEQSYQRSGSVDDDQIAKLGKQAGVKYVCVAEMTPVAGGDFVTARLIDVQTALVASTADGSEQINSLPTLIRVSDALSAELLKNALGNKAGTGKVKVAVYIAGEKESDINKVLGAKLVSAITQSPKFVAMERTNAFLKEMSKETNYQRSGNVDDNQLATLGKHFGVEYVCVADIMTSFGSKFLATRLINVETAMIIATSEKDLASEDIPSIIKITADIATELLYNAGAEDRAKEAKEKEKEEARKKEERKKRLAAAPNSIEMVNVGGFSIGKYEVTQIQWEAVMGSNPAYFKSDDLPVEAVSWNDVKEFISKLNSMTGKNYRLPTEAEWERAAKGGTNYEYSGSNSIDAVAWYEGNSESKTHPVGTKQPNGLGIYDITGNVWEWCEDCYDSSCSSRVNRGGSWITSAQNCRVAYRRSNSPGNSNIYLGFRLVLP